MLTDDPVTSTSVAEVVVAEVEKDLINPLSFKGGVEYLLGEVLYLRAGISTAPVQTTFGIGLKFNTLNLDIASAYHQLLGFTPGISLKYVLTNK